MERNGTRLPRRGLLQRAALAAGAIGLGDALLSVPEARAARQDTVITLHPAISFQGLTWGSAALGLVDEVFARYFYPSHPGVRVVPYLGDGSNGPAMAAAQAVADTLAGGANIPDTLGGCCSDFATYLAADLMLPLDPLFRRDGIDPYAIFSRGHLEEFTVAPQGLLGVPAFDGPQVMMVNEGTLDQLGLRYPEPGWTYEDAVRLWEASSGPAAGVPGGWRYGASLQWGIGDWAGVWLPPAWGGAWIDPSRTHALFDSPACIASLRWILDLFTRKVAVPREKPGLPGVPDVIHEGLAVMGMVGGWDLSRIAAGFQGFKWDFYPMPTFPSGHPSSYFNSDQLSVNAFSRYPELAWELFKFIAVSKEFQRFNMRVNLMQPSRLDMWEEWAAIITAAAPPLRGKNLAAWPQTVEYAHGRLFFKYAPAEANNMIAQATIAMGPPAKQDLTAILTDLTRRLNALEASGAALAAAGARQAASYATYIRRAEAAGTPITVPAPPESGIGAPSRPAGALVRAGAGGASLQLVGAGSGISGASDGITFAAQSYRRSTGLFTCRLVSIAAEGPSLSDGAKIGLLARSDLSDAAAEVGVEVATGRGVHVHVRPEPGVSIADQKPASATQASGLIGQAVLLRNDAAPANNYLRMPVWLRLAFDAASWTAYTSLDGTHWAVANTSPLAVDFIGCWVGVFASAHGGNRVVAVFDNLQGFRPDMFVQVGS